MADNRYRGYLDENRDTGSRLAGLATAGAIGAGVAALVSPSFRRGATNLIGQGTRIAGGGAIKLASYLNQAGRIGERMQSSMGFVKSMDYALDGRSPLSHFMNPQRFNQRFDEMIRKQVADVNRSRQTLLHGKPTQIETRYSQMMSDLPMASRMYTRSVQFRSSVEDLRRTMPHHFQDGLGDILTQQSDDFFLDPGHNKIRGLLDRFAPGNKESTFSINVSQQNRDDFVNEMFSTLKTYADKKNFDRNKMIKFGGEVVPGVQVQGAANMAKKIKDSFMEDNAVKDTWLSRILGPAGYRQASTRDFLEQDAKGKWVNKLFDNDSIIRQRKNGESYNLRAGDKLAAMANKDSRVLDLAVDHRVFVNDAGHILDTRGIHGGIYNTLSYIQKNFQIPFLRFNPLDLMHWTTYQAIKEASPTYFLRRGTIHPVLEGTAETLKHPSLHNTDAAAGPLSRDYMYANNEVFDVVSGQTIKKDIYLTSTRFGMMPRALSSMANLHRQDLRDRGALAKLFDVNGQESEHMWSRMLSTFTKFGDPNWARNRYQALLNPLSGPDDLESSYKDLYSEFNSRSTGFSYDTSHYINQAVKSAYGATDVDLTRLTTPQEVMETLGRINTGMREGNNAIVRGELQKQIGETWGQYLTNPDEFLKNKRIVTDNAPYMMGPLQAVDTHETQLVGKIDDVKRLIHQHAQLQLERRGNVTVADLVRQGINQGELDETALNEVRDMSVLTKMRSYWEDVYKNGPSSKEAALLNFQGDVLHDPAFRSVLADSVERHAPIWAMGPGDKPPQYFGFTGSTVMNKARGGRWWVENINQSIQSGVDPLKALGNATMGVLGQPFAGRKNLGDVTTASMFGYYFAERLDNMAAKLGLGLSQQNRGSMQGILGNQLLRRIVLPYAALQQLQYFDGLTNDSVSDGLAGTYANMTVDTAWLKDITGLNAIGKHIGGLFPGLDQLWKTPIGGALKYGTFGLLGDSRSADEMQQYYESGEDPVRKGRWWSLGSNTPWEGGKIDYYVPNWYRRVKSDYKLTDTMYGSENEYWANHWMPTLTHPLAPLRHFLTDPDHWANKHQDDRPYPISGGINEFEQIPLVGSLLNNTVGRVLNPYTKRKDLGKAHRQYQEELNTYIQSQYDSTTGSGLIQFMPAGGYQVLAEGSAFGGGFGEGLSSFNAPTSAETYGGTSAISGGNGSGGPISTVGDVSKGDLSLINQGIITGSGRLLAPVRPITTLSDLRDPDVVADLSDYANPYSGNQMAGDAWYSLTEMAGIYGFSANMFAGANTNVRSMALDRAGRMTSYSRSWWDMEMGGLGGNLSELFRRYVPRDPRKQYYNPFRNTMPDWLPGLNYYMDFQHGDPFMKVPRGELRLPGGAYERLNRLHPDQFGEYGAFDRFKILGDVAPYSDEYKFWRRMVSQMKQQGMLTDAEDQEYANVRDQIAQKKKKYHFYPNTFRNADIEKETVTITKVLDANTFLTREHPDNPIRLANVHIKSDATEVQQWLQQYIHEGATLKVGLDADSLSRVRDDTMNTMHAVVYSQGGNEEFFGHGTRGQALNGIIARRWGGSDQVTVKQENSAVGTAAMYDNTDIRVGKLWEAAVHNVLPNLPILGPIFDKFMQVRSPLEMYKKNEVYGKSWRPWTDPIGGWIVPMIQTAASHSPLLAAAQGYGTGWLVGRVAKQGKYYSKWIGAAIYGTAAALRSIDEFVGRNTPGGDDYTWIPERRRKERELNEYFDVLKYMKFKGLYERAKVEARRGEGVDLDTLLSGTQERGAKNKASRKYLEVSKKWLSISQKLGYVDDDIIKEQLDKVRMQLKGIDADRPSQPIGPKAMLALQYRLQYESTLYGADPNGDMTKIFRALPNKDREYFQEFMTASPSEREEILRLVPENEKRFFQAKWGMKADDTPSLSSYFSAHHLPSASWEGWRADVNLDDIKLKVVRNEGMEATEFGFWDDDQKRAAQSGVDVINPYRPSMGIDLARITKVLNGAGLSNVDVQMTTSQARGENRIQVGFDLLKDRTEDIKNELANNLSAIFS